MKCYAQFFLAGHASPMPDDFEEFHSLSDAKREFVRKHEKAQQISDRSSDMLVFFGKPEGLYPCDCLPDRVFRTGPRGGLVQLSC